MTRDPGWKLAKADIFWGDIAFHDHVLQIYDSDLLYIDALAGFVTTGLQLGDCCVIISTQAHRNSLESRLKAEGIDIDKMKEEQRFISVDAHKALASFMVNGMPNGDLLAQTLSSIFEPCSQTKRLIRAGGEMSAILFSQGNEKAAISLEKLTNQWREKHPFSIFCGFPSSAFGNGQHAKASQICAEHSKMISGKSMQLTDVLYNDEVSY